MSNDMNFDRQLVEDVGYIKGKVESIEKQVKAQNGTIVDLKKRMTKHDVFFGKIGVIVTGFIFLMTAVFNIIIDFFKGKFMN